MRQTENLGLALYDTTDKMNITGAENSLNHNMELIDAEMARNAQNIEAMNTSINGKVVENTYTETYECTAGTNIGTEKFFDLAIPEGTQYTFSVQQDGIFGGGVTLYDVGADDSVNKVTLMRDDTVVWSVTATATREIHKFALYAPSDSVTGSGTITMTVKFSADTINSVEKRLTEVETDVGNVQGEIETMREHNDELYGIINGTEYTKIWKSDISCTAGVGLNGNNIALQVDIKKGQQYTLALDKGEVITTTGIAAYAKDADGNGTSLGMLKENEGNLIIAIAGSDIVAFNLYISGSNVTVSGTLRLTAQVEVAATGALSTQVSDIADSVSQVSKEAMRGSSVMAFKTLFYSECFEIGASLNNDNNETYVYHDFFFDISTDECVGLRIGAIENATAGIKGYVDGSADGTEYEQILTFREAGVYHVYPPAAHTKIRVRLYPTTSGGLNEVTAKYKEIEIFTSSDGRRRLAQEYAPRVWDVPAYYLRDGYMDGKVNEILSRVDASGGNCDVFFFTTDQHWRWNTGNSPALIGYLSRRLNIERLFFGGDWADGYTENGILAFKEAFNGKIYHTLGNHDYMNYWCRLGEDENEVKSKELTPAMATFQTISRIDGIVLGDTMYGYYYVDNPTNKMRYIMLQVFTDESAIHLEQAQLDWLDSVLSSMPDGYLAVVFAHFLGNVKDDFSTELNSTTGVKVAQVCDKYASKVACMFNGHTHRDGMCKTDAGIPVFVTTCDCWYLAGLQEETDNPRVVGTRTEQVIEVVIVDKTNHKVSAVRIGCPARVEADTNVEVREQTFVGG